MPYVIYRFTGLFRRNRFFAATIFLIMAAMAGITRADITGVATPAGTNVNNSVMIYEKRTGTGPDVDSTYTMSVSLINGTVLFDNRIPPAGFDYDQYQLAGAK
ncbi:MAG: hypothetical protein WBB19_18735 [Desulforhopalus sp.]